jgi:hypothetical protein
VPWLGVGELVSLGMGGEFIAPARGPSGAALAGIIRYGVTSRTPSVTAPPSVTTVSSASHRHVGPYGLLGGAAVESA